MVWEWSHTDEAYGNVRDQIAARDRAWLVEVYAEIRAAVPDDEHPWHEPEFSQKKHTAAVRQAGRLADDTLADAIWEFASDHRECSNGGWEAYVCPWNCHSVPFDPAEVEA